MSRRRLLFSTLVLAGSVLGATAAAGAVGVVKPTIGRPFASPAKPLAGARFSVAFHVAHARSATFSVTLGTARIRHADSFHGGAARTTFVVPDASGLVHVKLTARSGRAVASRQVTYPVRATPPPSLSIAAASATEGSSGTTPMTFQVSLSRPSSKPVSVGYATSDGTATAPADYVATSGTLTFAPGETTRTITVPVLGDQAIEPDEQFSVTLSDPVNATVLAGTAAGTIHTHNAPNAGSWQGATQEGNYVYFTVTPAGTITSFRTNSLTENCNGDLYLQGSVDWGTQEFSIAGDGTLAAQYSGSGPPSGNGVEYTAETWKLTGAFTTTTISGTISLADELDYQGSHYSCSGSVTFTATYQGS
jgi:hypothetical protein